jgi:hypothetical protein
VTRVGLAILAVSATAATAPQDTAPVTTRAEMHNVKYHFDSSLAIHIRHLHGKLVPARSSVPPTFDDKRSFSVSIDSAEIAISSDSLATLMNKYVFNYPGAPIKKLKITMEGSELKQTGTVHKGLDLPFEMKAQVSATPDGRLRLHAVSLKVIHLPAEGALHLFGLHLSDMVNPAGAPGVQIEKDDLILNPSQMLPPPKMQGRVTAVRVEGDQLVQVFGAPSASPVSPKGNFMRFTGGTIRFGKLTMRDADLSLIDQDPRDPFEFSLDRYKEQLVAGYSKTTPTFGLDVFMPDISKLK